MDRVLGHPAVDPHGDPIPGGAASDVGTLTLAEASIGKAVLITRIGDQGSEFLRYAARTGLVPGATVTRVASDRAAGIGRVRIGKQEITLGLSALETIQVAPPPTVRERAAKRTPPRTRPKD
jgi:DtxR family Mn-dependent transcriptional regulator